MSGFWSWFIIILTVVNIAAAFWLIRWTSRPIPKEEGATTHHVWDGDIEEYNNPLPRWFLHLFYITIFFAIAYLALYPGLGNFAGLLGWSQVGQYEQEVERIDARFSEAFGRFAGMDIAEMAREPAVLAAGHNLYMNNCATCHGSDARGAYGFPNLRDGDWLWGGTPTAIRASIARGRTGVMPGWEAALGDDGIREVTEFVLALAGREHDADVATAGAMRYQQFCAACHGERGQGNAALGAANLSNDSWVHGGSRERIADVVRNGRVNQMPAQLPILGEERVNLLAAYIYSFGLEGKE